MKALKGLQTAGQWYKQKEGKLTAIAFAVLVSVFAVFFVLSQKASAKTLDNTYALSISTGAAGTEFEKFQYIAVHYTDTSGTARTHYLLPDTAQERSEAILAGVETDTSVRDGIKGVMDYDLTYDTAELFTEYSRQMLFFAPDYEVKTVDGVDFLTKSSGKWVCESLQVYRVDEIFGVRGMSYVSAQTYVEFRGTMLFTTTESTVTLNWTDFQMLQIGTSSNAKIKAASANVSYDNRTDSEYVVRLDVAEEYMAGLESLVSEYSDGKKGLADLKEAELLKLRLVYRDIYGAQRSVTVPVISNVIGYAIEQGVDTGNTAPLLELAGQGDTLLMKLRLPDFAELYTSTDRSGNTIQQAAIYLTCGGDNLLDGTGMTLKASGRSAERVKKAATIKDAFSLAGVSLYNVSAVTDTSRGLATAKASVRIENGVLVSEISGSPLYYHVASAASGDVISYAGGERSFAMSSYREGDSILPARNYNDLYLVELNTDKVSLAGTESSLTAEFSYMDLSNVSRVTDAYDLKELAASYCGYWPATGVNYAYLQGAKAEGVLRFVISLSNVDYFTGIRVTVDGKDEWQMSGMNIYKLTGLSHRVGSFQNSTVGTTSSHVYYTRAFEGTKMYGVSDIQMLVNGNQSKEFSFTSDSITEVKAFDWSDKKYSLTYKETLNNLGFTENEYSYTVEVDVAGDSQSTTSDGDSGSKNQFFFRLQFENGSSGYVLANQQMTSDGFRAGQTESFSINVNGDYGNVTAVQIIPETKNGEDYTYDKLNIDEIRIIQNSSSAMSKTWTVSNVGWIGAEYEDPGKENALRTEKGKYESELAKTYVVDYTTNVANLLFCLGTGSYVDKEGNAVEQFQGKVDVTLQYISLTGESRTATFDIVKYMYNYMDKTPAKDDSGVNSAAVSDTSYMFREGHMDRFILPVSDIQSLTRVDFYPTSTNGTTWTISSLSVLEISEQGSRYLSENDEFMYTGTTTLLCSNAEEINAMVCPKGTRQEGVKVNMTENKLLIDAESTKWVSVVSREPISSKDSLNIFLYMQEDAADKSLYDLNASVEYTNVRGVTVKTAERTMLKSTTEGENMFYLQGLEVKEMSNLNYLSIKCNTDYMQFTPIDYAMVQRVRSGVVIDTYYIYFAGADPGSSNSQVKAGPSSSGKDTGEYQVVSIAFGGDTASQQLIAENRDIAVAIRYVTSAGNIQNSATEYTSPYIFLTDQQYMRLYNGQSVDIRFNEKYVKKITGIVLVPSGQIEADITGAVAATYQADVTQTGTADGSTDGSTETVTDTVLTGWYSFPGQRHIAVNQGDNGGASILTNPVVSTDSQDVTGVVMPVTMTIKTADAAKDYESGTDTPIRMALYYTGANGQAEVYAVEDITKVAIKGSSFQTGGTATLKFMLTGVKSLNSVVFEPYDTDAGNIAAWTPEKMTIEMQNGNGTQTSSREIQTRYYEGMSDNNRITLSNTVLYAAVTVKKTATGSVLQSLNTMNQDVNVLLTEGQMLTVLPQIAGGSQSFAYKLERISSDGTAAAQLTLTADNGVAVDASQYLTVYADSLQAGSYQLTIYAKDNQKQSIVVKFTKEAAKTSGSGTVSGSDAATDSGTVSGSDATTGS